WRITNSPLDRELVVAVLGAPGLDDLVPALVPAHGETELVDGVADLDLLEEARRVVEESRRPVEVPVHRRQKPVARAHSSSGSPSLRGPRYSPRPPINFFGEGIMRFSRTALRGLRA